MSEFGIQNRQRAPKGGSFYTPNPIAKPSIYRRLRAGPVQPGPARLSAASRSHSHHTPHAQVSKRSLAGKAKLPQTTTTTSNAATGAVDREFGYIDGRAAAGGGGRRRTAAAAAGGGGGGGGRRRRRTAADGGGGGRRRAAADGGGGGGGGRVRESHLASGAPNP